MADSEKTTNKGFLPSFSSGIGKGVGICAGICLGIFLLVIIAGVLAGIGETKDNSTPTTTPANNLQGTQEKNQQLKIGDAFLVDTIAYQVLSVNKAATVGENIYVQQKADGIFLLVEIAIENRGKETQNIFSPRFKIIDDQGRKFDDDTTAEIYSQNSLSFGQQLQPGLPIKGVKIFDLPPTATGLKLTPPAVAGWGLLLRALSGRRTSRISGSPVIFM